jgi:pleiotropic regulator 1
MLDYSRQTEASEKVEPLGASEVDTFDFSASEVARLYTSGEDDVVKIFDLCHNRVVHQFRAHKAGVFALAELPDLQLLASGGRDRVIHLHDLRSKSPVQALQGHTAAVETLTFAGNFLCSGSTDTTVRVWDVVAGKTFTTLTNHKRAVKFLGARISDKALLTVGSDAVRVFSAENFHQLCVLHRPSVPVHAAALAELSGILAVAGDQGKIEFIDVASGQPTQTTLTIPPAPGSVAGEDGFYALTFDRSETRLIAGAAD